MSVAIALSRLKSLPLPMPTPEKTLEQIIPLRWKSGYLKGTLYHEPNHPSPAQTHPDEGSRFPVLCFFRQNRCTRRGLCGGERKHVPVGSIACIMMNRWLCGGHLWIFRVPLFSQVWTLTGILCHNNDRHHIASGLSPTHNHSRQWI